MPVFNLDFGDLEPVIEILEDALLNRAEPSGIAYYDVDSAIASASEYSSAIEDLSDPSVELDAWDFQHIVEKMAQGYKDFWEQPFPAGLEEGQFLFSAILEKPMKELLRNLKYILKEKDFDNNRPLISIDAEKEVNAFNKWLESISKRSSKTKYNSGLDFEWVLAAGLFGYWLGSREK